MSIQNVLSERTSVKCEACANRHAGICGTLSDGQLKKLQALARRRVVPESVAIFRAGDAADCCASVVSGVVKLTKTTAEGDHRVIALMSPPEFIGYTAASEHSYSAIAATKVELCIYPRAAFRRLLLECPELCQRLLDYTARELEHCRDWALILANKSSYERVAGFFVLVAEGAQSSQAAPSGTLSTCLQLPLTRTELADYLGLSLETVSRNITKLRQKGLIELRSAREIFVPDLERLTLDASIER
jgi:CRP/FNR family transcriptional regulator